MAVDEDPRDDDGDDAPSSPASPGATDTSAESTDRRRWTFLIAIAVAAGITLPLLGAIGFFDPWETNYAEVAREMGVRDDYLYPFWKDSYFFSKPVLLFWLTAPLYKLIGATNPNGPIPAIAELCGRLPSAIASLLYVAVAYFSAQRMWGRRAALYACVALSTMPLWAFMSRQAITDMLYVAPASAALLLLAVALFDDDVATNTRNAPVPRWLVAIAALCTLPQLWEIARSGEFLNRVQLFGSETASRLTLAFVLLVAAGALCAWLWFKARDPLLHAAAILFALSTLAKGPVGVAVCGMALIATIAILGEWDRLARPAAVSCTVLFLAITVPWTVVMLAFPGLDDQRKTWYQRFVLYDLLGRVGPGAHGDRGSFEYYVKYAGFAMFPWSGLVPPALWASADARHGRTKADRFTLLVAMWAIVTFAFFTATTTKFHHYIFPLVVPCALLIGRYLDRLVSDPSRKIAPAVAFVVVIACALIGRDLVQEPWQFIDLFTYHYKSYKPEYYFPSDDEWRIGFSIACFGAAFVIAGGSLWDLVRPTPNENEGKAARSWLGRIVLGRRGNADGFVVSMLVASIAFAIFAVQIHFNRASQHWSQRELFDTYYSMKKADEPIMAFQMDWKGETFYGKNADIQIKKSGADLKKAVERPGRSFVLVQTDRFGSLKSALGKEYESRIKVVDRSNQKWYLVLIDQ